MEIGEIVQEGALDGGGGDAVYRDVIAGLYA